MNNQEVYNQALEMLKKGHSKEEALVKFASEREELAPLLEVSLGLLSMPRNIVPTPFMQRRYAMAKVKNYWFTWLHISKFAGVSMSAMLLISAFAVMGYQASKSGPGQILFPVKKQAEQLKLILAADQNAKANLQIEIAQHRLDEAQAIFSDPASNIEQKKAALTELSDQTTSAVAQVTAVAKSDPGSDKNHPLLSVLDSITQKQQNLLAAIKPDSQITPDASSAQQALNANTVALSQIKNSIVAATNTQVITSLSADPNAVVIYGQITQVSKDQITVEKVTFLFGGQTTIKDSAGNNLSLESLKSGLKVNVAGVKSQNTLIAQQILLISTDAAGSQPQVKGATTDKAASPTNDKPEGQTTTPTSIKKPETPNPAGSDLQATQPVTSDQGTASGGFILEDPTPQFVK